jgi:hypothetical protein
LQMQMLYENDCLFLIDGGSVFQLTGEKGNGVLERIQARYDHPSYVSLRELHRFTGRQLRQHRRFKLLDCLREELADLFLKAHHRIVD